MWEEFSILFKVGVEQFFQVMNMGVTFSFLIFKFSLRFDSDNKVNFCLVFIVSHIFIWKIPISSQNSEWNTILSEFVIINKSEFCFYLVDVEKYILFIKIFTLFTIKYILIWDFSIWNYNSRCTQYESWRIAIREVVWTELF